MVGLPNVGKSSIINSLKRSRSCGVGATPGVTKTIQEVQLDSKVGVQYQRILVTVFWFIFIENYSFEYFDLIIKMLLSCIR